MKTSKIFSIIFLFIIFSFNIGIFINNINAHIEDYLKSKEFKENSMKNSSNYADWKKEYPIDDEKEANKNKLRQDTEKVNSIKFHLLYGKIKTNISKIDDITKRDFPFKMKFIEFGHFIDKLIGGNLFLKMDNLIRFDNGYFGFIVLGKDSFEEEGKRTLEFAKYLETKNIKFGYILCPSKFSKFKKELPQGMVDYSNENADSFLKILYGNNINVLDLRNDLNKEFPNHFDAFFKTDHHWKPETGFWATQKIIKFLNQKLGQKLDESIVRKENFNFKTYPKIFLGSQGKKVTLALAEPDDFTLIIPKFSTNFNFEIYGQGVLRNGNFENSLIEKNNLVKDYFKKSVYSTYLNLGRPVFRIKNICSSKESPKIFVIMDSYLKVVIPFLACVSREIIAVDPGKRNGEIHFDGSIKKFILKEKPDFVLLSYNVATFDKDSKVIDNFTTFH